MAKFYELRLSSGATCWINREHITDIVVPPTEISSWNEKEQKYEKAFHVMYSQNVSVQPQDEDLDQAQISTVHKTLEAAQAEAKMIAMGHDS